MTSEMPFFYQMMETRFPEMAKKVLTPEFLHSVNLPPHELAALMTEHKNDPEMQKLGDYQRRALRPALLHAATQYRRPGIIYSQREARDYALAAYYLDKRPLTTMGMQEWLDLFEKVGLPVSLRVGNFTTPVQLYRGSSKCFPHGLSWTPYFNVAAEYALGVDDPAVFEMKVQPFNFIHQISTPEGPHEVIVDSRRQNVRMFTTLA